MFLMALGLITAAFVALAVSTNVARTAKSKSDEAKYTDGDDAAAAAAKAREAMWQSFGPMIGYAIVGIVVIVILIVVLRRKQVQQVKQG
jgi:cobalamin biosynthesis Mg chelatase CobN